GRQRVAEAGDEGQGALDLVNVVWDVVAHVEQRAGGVVADCGNGPDARRPEEKGRRQGALVERGKDDGLGDVERREPSDQRQRRVAVERLGLGGGPGGAGGGG